MITTLDVETTFQLVKKGKVTKKDPSPYNPRNKLVSVGFDGGAGFEKYLCMYHNQQKRTEDAQAILQHQLGQTTLLVGHNLKFDLSWLRECGYIYDGPLYDTMIVDYVIAGGQKVPLSLDACCKRHLQNAKKSDIIETYMKKNVSFEDIPWEIVEEYGRNDVTITRQLFDKQQEMLNAETEDWTKGWGQYVNPNYKDDERVPARTNGDGT